MPDSRFTSGQNSVQDIDIAGVLAGLPQAIHHFVLVYTPIFRAVVLRLNLREHDSECLVQDIWLALVQNKFRPLALYSAEGGASLKTYLSRFAYYRIFDRLRKKNAPMCHAYPRTDEDLARLAQREHYGNNLQESRDLWASLIREAERALSPSEIKFFIESFIEERSVAELAASLKTSEEAIHTRRARVRKEMLGLLTTLLLDQATGPE